MGAVIISVLLVAIFGQGNAYCSKNVYECLADFNLTSFQGLIKDAHMSTQLITKEPFTIMAPSNDAIRNIDVGTIAALIHSPVLVRQIVRYHIFNTYEVMPALRHFGTMDTMEGQPMTFTKVGSRVLINNSTIADISGDIICNNGLIHIIDTVLLPPVFGTDNLAAVLLKRDDLFKELSMYYLLTHLNRLIEVGEYTIFAPTDLAFGRYSPFNDIRLDTPNRISIYLEVLKYHMVPGARTTHHLKNGGPLFTLHGSPVNITVTSNGMMVDNAKVVEADIPAANGVVFAIDHVLFPHDLLHQLHKG